MLQPKEKAEYLFRRFNTETEIQQPYEHNTHMLKAKQCAIICVEEILSDPYNNQRDLSEDLHTDFWQSVKQELEKF